MQFLRGKGCEFGKERDARFRGTGCELFFFNLVVLGKVFYIEGKGCEFVGKREASLWGERAARFLV